MDGAKGVRAGRCAAAVLMALLAGACTRAPQAPATKIYHHSEEGAPPSFDPAQASSPGAVLVVRSVYDTLYRYAYLARPYALKPNLAAAMPEVSADGLTWTIRLKPGVRFVDDAAFADGKGREVTADDVIYSLRRHVRADTHSQAAYLWRDLIVGLADWATRGADETQPVAGLIARDALTLEVHLTHPYPNFTHTLTLAYATVLPREAVQRYGRALAAHPVGSGPFKLVSSDGARTELARNTGFRQEPFDLVAEGYDEARQGHYDLAQLQGRAAPFVDGIRIDWIAQPGIRWAALQRADDVQYAELPPDLLASALATREPPQLKPALLPRYQLLAAPESGLIYVSLDMADARIGDSRDADTDRRHRQLRCAMSQAFDWQARNEHYYGGLARVHEGVLSPSLAEFDYMAPPAPPHDLAAAKRTLAEGGWTARNLPWLYDSIGAAPIQREMHEQWRGFMQALGWPVQRLEQRLDLRYRLGFDEATADSDNTQLRLRRYDLPYPDAEALLRLFYSGEDSRRGGLNEAHYANPEYDALYEQMRALPPGADRTELVRRMNALLIDDCAGLFALSPTRLHVWSRQVVALPDREALNGFWLRYVDVKAH